MNQTRLRIAHHRPYPCPQCVLLSLSS